MTKIEINDGGLTISVQADADLTLTAETALKLHKEVSERGLPEPPASNVLLAGTGFMLERSGD